MIILEKLAFVSESPQETLWWHLGRFRNVKEVAIRIRDRHNSGENAKKQAGQIRQSIEQSSEYYRAARSVSLATKPLLLYYGMAALAWAVVLFRRTGEYALDRLPVLVKNSVLSVSTELIARAFLA